MCVLLEDVCVSPYYLVSGPEPVPDDKLTASSIWTREGARYQGPSAARLNTLTWSPSARNTNEYIQVRILVYYNYFFPCTQLSYRGINDQRRKML